MAQGIEHPHKKSHHTDKKNVWEGDAGEENRQIILNTRTSETKSLDFYDDGGKKDAQDRDDRQDQGKYCEYNSGQFKCIFLAFKC